MNPKAARAQELIDATFLAVGPAVASLQVQIVKHGKLKEIEGLARSNGSERI